MSSDEVTRPDKGMVVSTKILLAVTMGGQPALNLQSFGENPVFLWLYRYLKNVERDVMYIFPDIYSASLSYHP